MSARAASVPPSIRPLFEQLEGAYPREGCGLILKGPGGLRVQPIDNAYDRLRVANPAKYPRSSRFAFELDPGQWLEVCRAADQAGESIACVYHSHCDCGAYFSAEDRAWAAPDGIPQLPGALYLVVAIDRGQVGQFKTYRWLAGLFVEAELPPWGFAG